MGRFEATTTGRFWVTTEALDDAKEISVCVVSALTVYATKKYIIERFLDRVADQFTRAGRSRRSSRILTVRGQALDRSPFLHAIRQR